MIHMKISLVLLKKAHDIWFANDKGSMTWESWIWRRPLKSTNSINDIIFVPWYGRLIRY